MKKILSYIMFSLSLITSGWGMEDTNSAQQEIKKVHEKAPWKIKGLHKDFDNHSLKGEESEILFIPREKDHYIGKIKVYRYGTDGDKIRISVHPQYKDIYNHEMRYPKADELIKDLRSPYLKGSMDVFSWISTASTESIPDFLEVFYQHGLIPDSIVDTIIEQIRIPYFRNTAVSMIAEIEMLLGDNWTGDLFIQQVLPKSREIASSNRREKILCHIVESIHEQGSPENGNVIFSLCQELTNIPANIGRICLELMLYELPPLETCISLTKKLIFLNVDTECSQQLQRLYSSILHSGKCGPLIPGLSAAQTPAELFSRTLFAWQQEKEAKDNEITKLKEEIARLKLSQ